MGSLTGLPGGPPGVVGLLTSLTPDAGGLLAAVVLGSAYAVGVQRVRARGLAWARRRSLAWGSGVGALLLATAGGVGRYAHALLWVFTLQVVVLLLVAPPLLACGRPLALAADALPAAPAQRVLSLSASRGVRAVTSPLVGPLVVPVLLAAVYFTPALAGSLRHAWAYQGLHLVLVGVGLLVALGLLGDGTERESSLALGAAVAVGFAEFLLDAVPGIVLRLETHLVAPTYWGQLHRPWGPAPLRDQQHAGAVLWFVAEFADLPFLAVLVARWVRADARDAARVDAELDRRAAAPADGTGQELRPWWETDPQRLGGHRVARRLPDPGQDGPTPRRAPDR